MITAGDPVNSAPTTAEFARSASLGRQSVCLRRGYRIEAEEALPDEVVVVASVTEVMSLLAGVLIGAEAAGPQ